jgi:hypothetical protein
VLRKALEVDLVVIKEETSIVLVVVEAFGEAESGEVVVPESTVAVDRRLEVIVVDEPSSEV